MKKYILFFIFSILLTNNNIYCNGIDVVEEEIETVEEKFNAGELIFDHILDSYDWHICTWKGRHISVYLPIIVVCEGELYCFSSRHLHHGHSPHCCVQAFSGCSEQGLLAVLELRNTATPLVVEHRPGAPGLQ